jgi:hypothetical protein
MIRLYKAQHLSAAVRPVERRPERRLERLVDRLERVLAPLLVLSVG